MLKKLLSLSLLVVITISLFAGCAGSNTPPKSSTTQTEKALETATVKFWVPSDGEVVDNYFINAAKEFETKFPQIKIELTKLPSANADIDIKLNGASLSNDFPDVFCAYLVFISTHGAKDEFLDLNPYLSKWQDKGDIIESALNMGVYKEKQYGVGYYPAPELLTYRTDYFKEAGLDPAKPPKTWAEIAEYANKLVKKDASGKVIRAGFDVPALGYEVFIAPFMRQAGSMVIDAKNDKPSFTDKGAIEALTFMASLKNQSIPFDGSKRQEAPFTKGNSAMGILNISTIASMIKADESMKEKLAFAPVTEKDIKSDWCGYRLFTIGSTSKVKDQSWEFVKFLLNKEQMMKRAKETNIPVVRKSLENDYISLDPKINTAITNYAKSGKGADLVSWTSVGYKYLKNAYEEVYTGKKSPEQALKDAEAALNIDLKAFFNK